MDNVKNAFFNAITAYNNTVTNSEKCHFYKFNHEELKGIFYNCLRRENLKLTDKRRWSNENLRVSDFDVTFDKNLRITSFKITTKKFGNSWVDSWSEDSFGEKSDVSDLKKFSDTHSVIYPNQRLNEMAHLITQIKT